MFSHLFCSYQHLYNNINLIGIRFVNEPRGKYIWCRGLSVAIYRFQSAGSHLWHFTNRKKKKKKNLILEWTTDVLEFDWLSSSLKTWFRFFLLSFFCYKNIYCLALGYDLEHVNLAVMSIWSLSCYPNLQMKIRVFSRWSKKDARFEGNMIMSFAIKEEAFLSEKLILLFLQVIILVLNYLNTFLHMLITNHYTGYLSIITIISIYWDYQPFRKDQNNQFTSQYYKHNYIIIISIKRSNVCTV